MLSEISVVDDISSLGSIGTAPRGSRETRLELGIYSN